MDKNTKFASIVKLKKEEIDYNELQNILLGEREKENDKADMDSRKHYNKYIQELFGCFKDPDFYQYLIRENFLVEIIQEFIEIIQFYLDEWDYTVASKEKAEILSAMLTIDDEHKLRILNLREEDEYRDYDTIYNPITERMDNEFIKAFIISLTEQERIEFLLNWDNLLHLKRFDSSEITEIFNSLSEENKLRIFSEFATVMYKGEILYRDIPILESADSYPIAFDRYDTLLAELIGDNLDFSSKVEILKNSQNKYDYVLRRLKGEVETVIRGLEFIDDDAIDIINTYLLHESDEDELNFIRDNLKRLKGINDDILETAKFELLTTKYQELEPKLDVITCYPEIQQQILELNDNQYRVLIETLKLVEQEGIKDWIPVFENVIKGLNSKKYASLMESIANAKIQDEETVRKLVYIISSSENIFEIHSIEELEAFDRIEYCEKIKSGELQKEYINGLTEIDRLKLCVLEKKYGQSLEESKRLLARYGRDLDKFEIQDENDMRVRTYLEALRNILTINDKSVLEELYNEPEVLEENYLFSNIIESEIRRFFVKQYNRELYQIDEAKKIDIDIPSASGLELYDVGENFKLIITSLGAYSIDYNSNTNFEQAWNRKQITSHGFCTSLIANNNIATAKIKTLILGFDNFAENSLLLSAPWDIRIK